MIQIAICDDNAQELHSLKEKVTSYLRNTHIVATVKIYDHSRMLKYDIEDNMYFDLVLSDIQMPYMNGMELAKYIKTYLPETLVIFITSHAKYAVDAFALSIFRYILKDSIDSKLTYALADAIQTIQLHANEYYIIQTSNRMEKIPYSKILYIQKDGKNAVLVLSNGNKTKVRKSLIQVFNELHSREFAYIDRGTIVNLNHIISIEGQFVELKTNTRLVTSHAKLEPLKQQLNLFWHGLL